MGEFKIDFKKLGIVTFSKLAEKYFLKKHWKKKSLSEQRTLRSRKKSCMQETLNISTNADRSTNNKTKLL